MRNLKIVWARTTPPTQIYRACEPQICWLSAPIGPNSYKVASPWHTCRELVIGDLRKYHISKSYPQHGISWAYGDIGTDRVRLVVAISSDRSTTRTDAAFDNVIKRNLKRLTAGIRILNMFEKRLGWTRSTLHKASNKKYYEYRKDVYVLMGSPKWMRSPQLLSTFLLLFRLGINEELSKPTSIDEWISAVSSLEKNSVGGQQASDRRYMLHSFKELLMLLDNYQELFYHRPAAANFKENDCKSGLYSLTAGTGDGETRKIWKSIKARAK